MSGCFQTPYVCKVAPTLQRLSVLPSLLWMNNHPLYGDGLSRLPIYHLLGNGVVSAAVSIHGEVFVCVHFLSLGQIARGGKAVPAVTMFNSLRNCQTISQVAAPPPRWQALCPQHSASWRGQGGAVGSRGWQTTQTQQLASSLPIPSCRPLNTRADVPTRQRALLPTGSTSTGQRTALGCQVAWGPALPLASAHRWVAS